MKILLVEGKKDAQVIKVLCETQQIRARIVDKLSPEDYQEENCFEIYVPKDSNDEKLLSEGIKSALLANGIQVVGIVLDADKPKDNPAVQNRVDAIKYQLGMKKLLLNQSGTILKETDLQSSEHHRVKRLQQFGFWLMPDNKNPGMLEDFLMKIVNKPEACIDLATQCIESVKKQNCHTFKLAHSSKAVIHTFLAWQDEPGNTLELSIKSGKFNKNAELSQKLIAWLKELFSC